MTSKQVNAIERKEYFVDTTSGMTIFTTEKRLSGSSSTKAVLLIHGAGVGGACWDLDIKDYSIMRLLAGEGFDVFAVDLRGYGKSTRPSGLTVTSETCADDLKSVIDFLRSLRNMEKVDIVGHSFGGMVAVCIAGKYPECVGKIVSIGAPYKVLNSSFQPTVDEFVEMANRGVPYVPNKHHLTLEQKLYSYEQEIVDAHKNMVEQSYPEWPTGVFLDLKSLEHSKYIPSIAAPTLLINGALEYVIDPDDAVQCLHDLGAEQKALLVIGNAYHLVWLEEIAHRGVNRAIAGWLRS